MTELAFFSISPGKYFSILSESNSVFESTIDLDNSFIFKFASDVVLLSSIRVVNWFVASDKFFFLLFFGSVA